MTSVKAQVETLLRSLPESCTFEDVQYGIYILERIRKSEESIRSEGTVGHDQAKARFARFLEDRN